MSSLFASLGAPCGTRDDGDPIVLYDRFADRWLISQFVLPNYPSGPFYEEIAISQTGDPTGAYYLYCFMVHATEMNDYPHFGIWPDGYYMTATSSPPPALGRPGRLRLRPDQNARGRPHGHLHLLRPELRSIPNHRGHAPRRCGRPYPAAGGRARRFRLSARHRMGRCRGRHASVQLPRGLGDPRQFHLHGARREPRGDGRLRSQQSLRQARHHAAASSHEHHEAGLHRGPVHASSPVQEFREHRITHSLSVRGRPGVAHVPVRRPLLPAKESRSWRCFCPG